MKADISPLDIYSHMCEACIDQILSLYPITAYAKTINHADEFE